ncbi:MAG: MBL fold metallo-hydrolase [Thermomicrobiales bacterium]
MSDQVEAMATFRRWTIGDVRVTRILELPPMAFDPAMFLQTTREEILRRRDWLVPHFATDSGDIILHFQAFMIEAAGKRIMVDPCIGNDKPRAHPQLNMLETAFLERLAEAGFPRESIDHVLCTHLHVDHCGWNTMLVDGVWMPTFPNARYLFAKAELDYAKTGEGDPDAPAIYRDSVKPIVDAGLVDLIEPGHMIADGITIEQTPGHTPGHCSVMIASLGLEAIITGDVIHHPIQASMPHVSSNFCWDQELGARTRRALLEQAASRRAMMFAAHFAGPTAVYLKPDGDAWRVEEV